MARTTFEKKEFLRNKTELVTGVTKALPSGNQLVKVGKEERSVAAWQTRVRVKSVQQVKLNSMFEILRTNLSRACTDKGCDRI